MIGAESLPSPPEEPKHNGNVTVEETIESQKEDNAVNNPQKTAEFERSNVDKNRGVKSNDIEQMDYEEAQSTKSTRATICQPCEEVTRTITTCTSASTLQEKVSMLTFLKLNLKSSFFRNRGLPHPPHLRVQASYANVISPIWTSTWIQHHLHLLR